MKKRKSYSATEKLEALKKVDNGEKRTIICKSLHIQRSTLSEWFSMREKIEQQVASGAGHLQKGRPPEYPELDQCMFTWSSRMRQAGAPLTDEIYRHQAAQFALRLAIPNFSASAGWVRGFKERHGLRMKVRKNRL
jgi:hypothetical protein